MIGADKLATCVRVVEGVSGGVLVGKDYGHWLAGVFEVGGSPLGLEDGVLGLGFGLVGVFLIL